MKSINLVISLFLLTVLLAGYQNCSPASFEELELEFYSVSADEFKATGVYSPGQDYIEDVWQLDGANYRFNIKVLDTMHFKKIVVNILPQDPSLGWPGCEETIDFSGNPQEELKSLDIQCWVRGNKFLFEIKGIDEQGRTYLNHETYEVEIDLFEVVGISSTNSISENPNVMPERRHPVVHHNGIPSHITSMSMSIFSLDSESEVCAVNLSQPSNLNGNIVRFYSIWTSSSNRTSVDCRLYKGNYIIDIKGYYNDDVILKTDFNFSVYSAPIEILALGHNSTAGNCQPEEIRYGKNITCSQNTSYYIIVDLKGYDMVNKNLSFSANTIFRTSLSNTWNANPQAIGGGLYKVNISIGPNNLSKSGIYFIRGTLTFLPSNQKLLTQEFWFFFGDFIPNNSLFTPLYEVDY